ncbi:PREDICTED: calpain-9 [Myotis brandtii]|uniref:calpain-9 n=1 Tax=Myotis brandtii TaxID=109478 RepID=UPI000703FB2A|nr:PREDICTED: calpain-9 [Myotis brandtii]
MPYLLRAPGPQEHPTPRDARGTHSSGQSFEQLRRECLQKGVLFEDPDLPATDSSLFYSERPQIPFVWKRPGEIVENPEFILGGATRTDIYQGELGECERREQGWQFWQHSEWLDVVVDDRLPTFRDRLIFLHSADHNEFWSALLEKAYAKNLTSAGAGRFWQHSEWLDVVVDDRLPTFRDRLIFLHSADHNEFWSALLEKAYAKLNGSYEALKGGSAIEAMEDFTGGVAETFSTKEAPENFYEILEKALQRGSLVGCSIDIKNSAESEARTPFGLIKGHAYTVTGIDQVGDMMPVPGANLVPHRGVPGSIPIKGTCPAVFAPSSPEWRAVGPAEQQRLSHAALDDGEFWMAFSDFKAHFDKVEICNLTPDALEEDAPHKWEVTVHQGSWVRGSTAGGCRNFLDTFWTNPQIRLSLTEKDDGQEACTLLVALMQKDRRKLKRFGANVLTIGYAIYQCPGKEDHLDKDFFRYHASQARSKSFINLREVSDRFKLPPGDYILIPSTFEPHQEADFCLRIFSDKKTISRDLDGHVDIDLPEPPKPTPRDQETEEEQQFRALFESVAGEDMEVTAEELEFVLNAVLSKKKGIRFEKLSLISCKNIISLMDTSGNGKLEFDEFKVFWEKLKTWTVCTLGRVWPPGPLQAHSRGGSIFLSFQLSRHLLQLVVLRYADQDLQLGFDDFLNCLVRLENASRVFQALSTKNKEFIHLNINEFINLTMNI